MKPAKTWCLAALIVVAGLSSASCGKDEGTDGGGGRGMVLGGTGGSAGSSGGVVGRSGSGGTNLGGDDTGGPTAPTKLGRACLADKDCVDAAAPGLTCITSKDAVLADGAPPKGLCSMACSRPQQEGDVDVCADLGPGAFCYPFSGETEGYCVEGCYFGPPVLGDTKCHNRPEFACNPALFGPPTGSACTVTADCPAGDLCIDGECNLVTAGCLPSCRGDLDCDAGMYCNQSFFGGTCLTEEPKGKALGEPCDLPAAGDPEEPDECVGYCQADAGSTTKGHCSATCGLGRECGWNTATEKYDGLCQYPTILTMDAATADLGDFGFCTPTCNCTSECNDPELACTTELGELDPETFKGSGLCFGADPQTPEYNQCTGAGGGGSGGESGAGASGAAGSGGGGDGSGGAGG